MTIVDHDPGERLVHCAGCGWKSPAPGLVEACQALADHADEGCEPDDLTIYRVENLPPALRRRAPPLGSAALSNAATTPDPYTEFDEGALALETLKRWAAEKEQESDAPTNF